MKTMLLTEAIQQGIVRVGDAKKGIIGDYIAYKPIKKTCILTPSQTGWENEQSFTTEELHWRIEQVDSEVLLLPEEPTTSEIILCGEKGYENGISAMNCLVKELFSSPMATEISVVTREMFLKGISQTNNQYWLGSRGYYTFYVIDYFGIDCFGMDRLSQSNKLVTSELYDSKKHSYDQKNKGVRPVVSLKTDIHVVISEESDGSKEKPWELLESDSISNLQALIEEGEAWLERLKALADGMK